MAFQGYKRAPESFEGDPKDWLRQLAQIINRLLSGATNAVGTVTLTANTTTTTINSGFIARLLSPQTRIFLMPTTANAAAALGTTYVSARDQFSLTLTHSNNAQTDRTFDYVIFG